MRARRRLFAALLLAACAFARPASAVAGFDIKLNARVFGAGLNFAAPRTLDPVTAARLTLNGLHAVTVLDPTLTTELRGNLVRLSANDRLVFARVPPPPDDHAGWGRLAAEILAAAWDISPAMRHAGTATIVESFFDEMFAPLDPYSRYVPPAPAEEERDKLSLDAGAGLGLVREHGGVVVADVVPGGPGAASGVRVGDRILAVNGDRVTSASVARVTGLLTGPNGENVDLRVLGRDGERRELVLTLAYVPPETVFSARTGDVLTLRVTAFDGNTAQRLSQALEAGMAEKPLPAAVVIDLRGNRGGLLRQAVTSVALLAEQGVIASTVGRDPQATHDWRIDGGGDLTHGLHQIVLVDGRTASAAEIMAASLADLGRAVVVGSATLGKGLVQTIDRLPDGGELFVTWSRVIAPRGWPIQTLGVLPQICTSGGSVAAQKQLDDLAAGSWDMRDAVMRARAARVPLKPDEALALRAVCPAAEGTDLDAGAARFLAAHPVAYAGALIR